MVFKQKLQQRAKKSLENNLVKKFSVYDVILANAVLLHFTKDEQEKIIQNVKNSLKE